VRHRYEFAGAAAMLCPRNRAIGAYRFTVSTKLHFFLFSYIDNLLILKLQILQNLISALRFILHLSMPRKYG
jgi:hypothetical protein